MLTILKRGLLQLSINQVDLEEIKLIKYITIYFVSLYVKISDANVIAGICRYIIDAVTLYHNKRKKRGKWGMGEKWYKHKDKMWGGLDVLKLLAIF